MMQWGAVNDNDINDQMKALCEVKEEDEKFSKLPQNVTNKQALFTVDILRRYTEHQINMFKGHI